MATFKLANVEQSSAEVRTWVIDFTDDLLTGVTVSSGTAIHTPPSGTAGTPTVAVSSPKMNVTLGPLSVIPDLKRISSSHQKSPFVLLGVNMHDERGAMDRYIAKHDVRWPQISGQASQRLIDIMQVSRIPTEFLFDHEGVLVTGSTGWSSRVGDSLFEEIDRAVQKAKKVAAAAGKVR